jgi:hypothetical protein
VERLDDPQMDRWGWSMTYAPRHDDALVSSRVDADLCGVSPAKVTSLILAGAVRETTIRGQTYVSLRAVEVAITKEGGHAHAP